MTFGKFGRAKTLAPPYIFGLASCIAGVPTFIVGPPASGKSTVIFAIKRKLDEIGVPNAVISRLGLKGLKKLCVIMHKAKNFALLNEEYSLIGSSDYMVEKMGELVGTLSYQGYFFDPGLGIEISVQRLGFVSGVQPLWLINLVSNPVFTTFLKEKFIRYYMLPYEPSEPISQMEAINILVERLEVRDRSPGYKIPNEFIEALTVQLGPTRAREYAHRIAKALSILMPQKYIYRAMKFYAERIAFEDEIMTKVLTEKGFRADVRWREYTVLYWALRFGKLNPENLKQVLGLRSSKSVYSLINAGIQAGWLAGYPNNGKVIYVPNPTLVKRLRWGGGGEE